jgi:peroxisomal 2,4-dienoyl-CoA reductase
VTDIDLVGTFNMSKACFEELKKSKGSIINISATLHYSTTPWQAHASAAKVPTIMKN